MIPESEWLSNAKALVIGMRNRTFHLREGRPNLVIGNDSDKWWCYCHKCHEGGVVQKDHVMLTQNMGPVDVEEKLPDDIKPVLSSEFEIPVAKFLASKNMDQMYLPELFYSEKRKRLMLMDDKGCWHGRDLTERSPMKWMNYSNAKHVGYVPANNTVVVVEDLFSRYKVKYACHNIDTVTVCALGTGCHSSLVNLLMPASRIVWFFDADNAGDTGADKALKRMRLFVDHQARARPPEGLDPKDMDCQSIRDVVLAALRGVPS